MGIHRGLALAQPKTQRYIGQQKTLPKDRRFWMVPSVIPAGSRTRQGRDWARGRGRGDGESFLRLQQGAIRLGNRKNEIECSSIFERYIHSE